MSSEISPSAPLSGVPAFARKATGLVREASTLDAIVYNYVANGALHLGFGFQITFLLFALNGVDIIWAAAIGLLLVPFSTLTWTLLSAALPRTGGEYIFNTRILNPTIGFMGSWVIVMIQLFTLGLFGYYAGPLFFSPVLAILGVITGESWFAEASTTAATSKGWIYGLGAISLCLGALALSLGLRATLLALKITGLAGIAGGLIAIAALFFSSRSEFEEKVGSFLGGDAAAGGYQGVIDTATEAGLNLSAPTSWGATFAAALLYVFVCQSFWSAYISGEIRRGGTLRRQAMVTMFPAISSGILLLIGTWGLVRLVGEDFLRATTYLWYAAPDQYPLSAPPYAQLFPALVSNDVIGVLGTGLFAFWAVANAVMFMLLTSRMIFAWSFDRLLPAKMSEIHPRLHSPLWNIGTMFFVAMAWMVLFVWGGAQVFTWVSAAFVATTFVFLIVNFTGVVFPFRRPALFASSPANIRIGKVPVIVPLGILGICLNASLIYAYWHYPSLGLTERWQLPTLLGGMCVGGIVLYYVIKAIRASQGINMDLIYQEIPPE